LTPSQKQSLQQVEADLTASRTALERAQLRLARVLEEPDAEPPSAVVAAVALCVGHSRQGDNGAVAVGGVTEFRFNSALAPRISQILSGKGIQGIVIDEYEGSTYGAAMTWLASELREFDVALAIELHFNAAHSDAMGYEYLHHAASAKGKRLAQCLHDAHKRNFPSSRSRGIKSPPSGRGDAFLKRTHCPAVICEPFFGSNSSEWEFYRDRREELPRMYAEGLEAFLL